MSPEDESLFVRAIKSLLENAPDAHEHLSALTEAILPALHHPSYAIRSLCCDAAARLIATSTDKAEVAHVAGHLPEVLSVRLCRV